MGTLDKTLTIIKMCVQFVWAVVAGIGITIFFILMVIAGQYDGEHK